MIVLKLVSFRPTSQVLDDYVIGIAAEPGLFCRICKPRFDNIAMTVSPILGAMDPRTRAPQP